MIAHVILGFPGETKEMMKDTVRHVAALPFSGIKLQLLHVVRGTALAVQYHLHPFPMMELDEYSEIVIDCVEILPPDMVVHRLTGDGPRSLLPVSYTHLDVYKRQANSLLNTFSSCVLIDYLKIDVQ